MFSVLILAVLVCLSVGDKNVSQNFRSDCILKYGSYSVKGKFVFNKKRYQYFLDGVSVHFGVKVDFSFVEINGTVKEVVSQQCRPTTLIKLDGMFGWLEYAKEIGEETIEGQKCTMYSLYIQKVNETLYLCIGSDTMPVYFSVLLTDGSYQSEFTFMNQEEGDFPVVFPEICRLPLNTCVPESPEIKSMEMVRFHNTGDYSLANENTATMMGDVFYVCMTKVNNQTSKVKAPPRVDYDVISIFEVSVNTTWGQYALCNSRQCIGGMKGTVGREVALGNAPWGGQCALNKIEGSWFSLLERDECKEEEEGSRMYPCAWKVNNVKKTITYKCLASHGFEESCIRDAHSPFTTSFDVFKKAFDSDDVAEGGCPDVKPTK